MNEEIIVDEQELKKLGISDDDFRKSSFTIFLHPKIRCVEVAAGKSIVAVRNSTDPSKNTLVFTGEEWVAFIKGVKAGEFD